jgi:hypothetical protein
MAIEVHRKAGPDFRQNGVPADATIGNLWFSPQGGNCAMSNGTTYGGVVERVGIAGYIPTNFSFYSKLVFQTEVVSSIQTNGFFGTQPAWAAVASAVAGYNLGGYDNGSTVSGKCTKIIFQNEATSSLVSALSQARAYGTGVKTTTNGYVSGGQLIGGSTSSTRIDELIFSTDAIASIATGLNNVEHGAGGVQSGLKGYFCGGVIGATATYITNIDKFTFSTRGVAAHGTGLAVPHQACPSYSSEVAGYINGGASTGATHVSSAQKLDFATETLSTLSNQSAPRSGGAGNASYVNGYSSGGWSGSAYLSTVEKLAFANDARVAVTSTLSVTLASSAANDHLNAPLGSA